MSSGQSFPALERSTFFDGQRLLADDLKTAVDYQRELHWLHNRSLHGWGIALGLEVEGEKGGRFVRVAPGYALDCRGRDIILARPEEAFQVPPVIGKEDGSPKEYWLVVSYLSDDSLPEAESRAGVCIGGGAVLRKEVPLIRWCDPTAAHPSPAVFRPGLDILLASVKVAACTLAEVPGRAGRRSLSPPHRPLIRGGKTGNGSTTWEVLTSGGVAIGVQTQVDTSSGRFQLTPAYNAQLVGHWTVSLASGDVLAAGVTQIAEATAQGFLFQVHLPSGLHSGGVPLNPATLLGAGAMDTLKTQARWHVHWVGIED